MAHGSLTETWTRVRQDAARWIKPQAIGDPAEVTPLVLLRLLVRHPSLRATTWFRIGTFAAHRGIRGVPSWTQRRLLRLYGLEMLIPAKVGGGLYIAHPVGCVLSAESIGENVTVVAQVTFGARNEPRWPQIGSRTFFGAGSRVLGNISVGDGAWVGANAVVLDDVRPDSTVVGAPARPISRSSD